MKELAKSLVSLTFECGIISFNNDNHMPSPDFFEPSNIIIFPEPNMKPNSGNNVHYNINLRYFVLKYISIQSSDDSEKSQYINYLDNSMENYIKKHYNHDLGKFEIKSKTIFKNYNSDIPYYDLQTMLTDPEDKFSKKFIRYIYENLIDDISSYNVEDGIPVGRLLRLYNEPNRENAVYNTERCGFSVTIKMTDESYLGRVLNIFNKVDYGFIKSQIMKEEYTEIGVFIYSKDKLSRERDIQKITQFVKGYLKCYDDSIEILRFDVLNTKDDVIYHKFNLTGHDNEVFGLHGENVGFSYFKFTDKSDYNLAENIYEQVDEFDKVVEYGNVPNPGNRIIITLEAGIKNGITPRESEGTFVEIYDMKLLENASFIPEKYSYIKDIFSNDKTLSYRETTMYNSKIERGFIKSSENDEYFDWFKIALSHLCRRLCFIDHTYKNQLFYGPYLNNMTDFIKFEFANPIRTSKEEAPELARIFFNVKLNPYVTKNIKPDKNNQEEFNNVVKRIMDKKITVTVPELVTYDVEDCKCRGGN